jgi:myo-inositol-1(or 4)-monophosphatase
LEEIEYQMPREKNDNSQFFKVAMDAVKDAGKVLAKYFTQLGASDIKSKSMHDVVSVADLESEKIILKRITTPFPDHNIVAEESGTTSRNNDYTWYVDPLDGTANFVMGNPYFSTSIGLEYKNEMILGVVYNPVLDELYRAVVKTGAYLNNTKISVSEKSRLDESFLAVGYAPEPENIKEGLNTVEKLALVFKRVSINFSPALDLCNIARGRVDALIDNGTTPEDHAAGTLILKEAGGSFQNYNKETWDVNTKGIVATNTLLHNQLLDVLNE